MKVHLNILNLNIRIVSDFTSMSCLTLPLDEPLDPPLTPPERDTKMGRQMIPCVEAIMINPVISRRGYLLVLEQEQT